MAVRREPLVQAELGLGSPGLPSKLQVGSRSLHVSPILLGPAGHLENILRVTAEAHRGKPNDTARLQPLIM